MNAACQGMARLITRPAPASMDIPEYQTLAHKGCVAARRGYDITYCMVHARQGRRRGHRAVHNWSAKSGHPVASSQSSTITAKTLVCCLLTPCMTYLRACFSISAFATWHLHRALPGLLATFDVAHIVLVPATGLCCILFSHHTACLPASH